MRLKNIVITVTDMDRSKRFYKELFGLDVIRDNEGNVILTEGLVLQDRMLWEKTIGTEVIGSSNASFLYFEERDIDAFLQKLNRYQQTQKDSVKFLCQPMQVFPGRTILRFYDPDGNLIEVGTPWQ